MIVNLSTSLLTSNQLVDTADHLINATTAPFDGQFAKRLTRTGSASEQLTAALNKDSRNAYTKPLREADDDRDDACLFFKYGALGAEYHPDQETRAAGIKVKAIFDRHDTRLYNLGYTDQSTEMKSLIGDLESNLETVNNSGLTAHMDYLKSSQLAFEQVYQAKIDFENNDTSLTETAARKELAEELDDLIGVVRIAAKDDPEAMATLVNKYNEVINEVMALARARRTRRENASQNPSTDNGNGNPVNDVPDNSGGIISDEKPDTPQFGPLG